LHCRRQGGDDHVHVQSNQLGGFPRQKRVAAFGRAHVQPDVLTFDQADRGKRGAKPVQEVFGIGISCEKNADGRDFPLLRARRQRRRRRRAAEQRDEVASSHSITSSARAWSVSGTVSPRAFAVLRLTTNSNLVGWMTGKSAGLVPFRMLPT